VRPELRDIQVVILCGGMGTRLREASERLPKPLVDIGSRPILWHIMKIRPLGSLPTTATRRAILVASRQDARVRRVVASREDARVGVGGFVGSRVG
jgi:dTDP-glucose pyrophosphorylase